MSGYYERYRDPYATFVMIQVQVMTSTGRWDRPFHMKVSEEQFEEMQAQSNRQYERRQWPNVPMGQRYEPARSGGRRGEYYDEYPHYGAGPRFTEDFFTREPPRSASHEEQKRAKEQWERSKKANEEKAKPNSPPTPEAMRLANSIRLATLAGIKWSDGMELRPLWKRAQRRCHPDVETGSHKLWIELETIAIYFGFVKGSAARPNYSGRSAG